MAIHEDIQIDQGTDVAIELHLKDKYGAPKNLTGYTVTAKMKRTYNSDSDETTDFSSTIAAPETDGVATISLTNAQTDLLTERRYVYDVELSYVDSDANTIIERILEGQIIVAPSVTR